MSKVTVAERDRDRQETIRMNRRCDSVARKVLNGLGRPDDLFKVDVVEIIRGTYRVNVWREVKDRTNLAGYSRKITDWFWVQIYGDGMVSNPSIDRKYYDDFLEELPRTA